ncbi:hypothetical protein [Pseudomonas sp. CJQ_13]|uniref:hypothetical protein n=1 Tax=Pseudomonas sp. CJQ_13 TaxID=3367170 RepID=UPI00370BF0AA
MDKPIGAVRAALRICLENTEVEPDAVIGALQEDMEHNQSVLEQVLLALRTDPRGLLEHMPNAVKRKKIMDDMGV